MIINNYNVYNNRSSFPSFGKIQPAHLFINSHGYEKNNNWANHVVGIIENAKDKISKNFDFKEVINSTANEYGDFFKHYEPYLKNIKNNSENLSLEHQELNRNDVYTLMFHKKTGMRLM